MEPWLKLFQMDRKSAETKPFDAMLSIKTVIPVYLDCIREKKVKYWEYSQGNILETRPHHSLRS